MAAVNVFSSGFAGTTGSDGPAREQKKRCPLGFQHMESQRSSAQRDIFLNDAVKEPEPDVTTLTHGNVIFMQNQNNRMTRNMFWLQRDVSLQKTLQHIFNGWKQDIINFMQQRL